MNQTNTWSLSILEQPRRLHCKHHRLCDTVGIYIVRHLLEIVLILYSSDLLPLGLDYSIEQPLGLLAHQILIILTEWAQNYRIA